jgi:hypothetical protein
MFGLDKETTALLFGLITVIINGWIAYYMRKLEKNTNSMKDALVASTAKSSHAEGKLEGKAESRTEGITDAATLREGPANHSVNMEVKQMDVAELNVPEKKP